MSFRAINDNATNGYGVSTKQINTTNADIQHSIIDIIINEDFIPIVAQGLIPEDAVKCAMTLAWRVKLFGMDIEPESLKVYNARNGRSQFGEYVVGVQQYFIDNGFISFESWISDIYRTSIIFDVPNIDNLDIPCDEPPVDTDFPPDQGVVFYHYSNAFRGTTVRSFNPLGANPTENIGDSFFAYMNKSVRSLSSAVSYTMSATYIDREENLELAPRYTLI